ncbi:MAG: MFS transporter [Eubacterium sp.]
MKDISMNPNAKLSFMERFAYGLGDYSGNLIYSSISSFLIVYYSSVVGANTAVAASIIAVSKIFDGISDLVMGSIVDNTHSKYGKARPWLIRLCIPLAVCTVAMFTVPASLTGGWQFAYMFITYNLVSTVFYTGINVPYATLNGLMTTNQYERGLLGNYRMLLATAGTMTVNTFLIKLVTAIGGNDTSQWGWTWAFVIFSAVFVILNAVTFFFCKERVIEDRPDRAFDGDAEKKSGANPIVAFRSLITNKYWLLMVLFLFSLYFMMSLFFGSAFYFAKYSINNESKFALLSNALSIGQIAMMFLTPFIMKKIGKRNTALIGMIIACVAFGATALCGSNITALTIVNFIKGMAFGFGAATMFGMLQDAITYGEWKSGVQATGMGNAASSFCMKIGSGLGTAALGWILNAGGFNEQAAITESAVNAINVSYIWAPLITVAVGVAALIFFNLDGDKYEKAVSDLEKGRHYGDSE